MKYLRRIISQGLGLLVLLLFLGACSTPTASPTASHGVVPQDVGVDAGKTARGMRRAHPAFTKLQREISAVLRQQPLMDALAARYPVPWYGLIQSLAAIERNRRPSTVTARRIAAFKADIAPQLRDLTARMPDRLLSQFFAVKAESYAWYARHYPARCEQALVGGEAGRREMNWLFDRLPKSLRRRHVDITARIVRETPQLSSTVLPGPVTAPETSFDPALALSTASTGCAVIAERIRLIAGLPVARANSLYRQMLPRKMPAIYRTPATVLISPAKNEVTLHGRIGHGSARLLESLLTGHQPGIARLVLHSEGGLLSEAFALAALVRRHQLVTVVQTRCSSACTVVLMAGVERLASPYGMIGFHRPAHAGAPEQRSALYRTTRDYRRLYPLPGISEQFLARIATTPSTEVWYPTWAQLMQNRIVTGSLKRTVPTPRASVRAVTHRAPGPLVANGLTRAMPGQVGAAMPLHQMTTSKSADTNISAVQVDRHVAGLLRWTPVAAFASRYPLEWTEEIVRAADLLPAHPGRLHAFVWARIEARYDTLTRHANDALVARGLQLMRDRMALGAKRELPGKPPACQLRFIPPVLRGAFIASHRTGEAAGASFSAELQLMTEVLRHAKAAESALHNQTLRQVTDARRMKGLAELIGQFQAASASKSKRRVTAKSQCRQNLKLLDHWASLRGEDQRMLARQLWRQLH